LSSISQFTFPLSHSRHSAYLCRSFKERYKNKLLGLKQHKLMTRLFFPAFIAILTFSACTTDFELEAPWKDLPVVYAFINMQDTAHYVRVEKAFLQPGGNANAIAQIADSLYYDASVIVQLEKKATGQRYTLQRVDGNLEGYPREEGPFAQAPNYLYKIKASDINLSAEQELRLIINRGGGLPAVTADAIVLGPMAPRFNVPGSPLNLDYNRTISFFVGTCRPPQPSSTCACASITASLNRAIPEAMYLNL
jgi:hypothetical protein